MVRIFHQIAKNKVNMILQDGLLQRPGGERRNAAITRTDAFLNDLRPKWCIQKGLDRKRNVYCYLVANGSVIDVTSGKPKLPLAVLDDSSQALLAVDVDPSRCFVSDLDLYDRIARHHEKGEERQASILGRAYWDAMQSLEEYQGSVRRPEVMVTYDVPSSLVSTISARSKN